MQEWQACQILRVKVREKQYTKGFLKMTDVTEGIYRYEAQIPTSSGAKTIFESDEYDHRYAPDMSQEELDDEHTKVMKAYNQVLSHLLDEGWEPVGTNAGGQITNMKRKVATPPSRSITIPSDLLIQLDSLRAAGLLTEQEFQTKKEEILKRM